MAITDDFISFTKYNQLEYEVEMFMDNSGGESLNRRRVINPNSVVNLTINSSLANWVTQGSLSIMYSPDGIGTSKIDPNTGQILSAETGLLLEEYLSRNYAFRNDGYDLLRIRIIPRTSFDGTGTGSGYNVESDRKFWTISHLFSIYDREDIDLPPGAVNAASTNIKCLKLYFWDCWYQKLNTKIIEYSTALSPKADIEADKQQQKYNNYGLIYTGEAMREIINIGLSEDNDQSGYNDNFSIIDPSIDIVGDEETSNNPVADIGDGWEKGRAKIFYTTPANTTAYDSLMYLYEKHISEVFISRPPAVSAPRGGTPDVKVCDFSILTKERGPQERDFGIMTLRPMSYYFEQAGKEQNAPGDYQIEHFFLQNYSDEDNPTKTLRAPRGNGSDDTKDIVAAGYNGITNYRFVDIAAVTNSTQFNSRPVYSFDFKNRTFNIEFTNNNVVTAREFIAKKYIDNVYKANADVEKLFLLTIDRDKKDKNLLPVYSLDGDNPEIRQHVGLQHLLKIGVFQNACINFRALGLTFRDVGRFIAIDKTTGVDSGEFEDKFYGQWFIIDIKHIFEGEMYYNDITAIKIHRFDAYTPRFTGTIDTNQ